MSCSLLVCMRRILTALCLVSSSLTSCGAESASERVSQDKKISVGDIYLSLLGYSKGLKESDIDRMTEGWQLADVPMMLESVRFAKNRQVVSVIYDLLKEKSGKNFALGSDEWQQWLWSQKYKPHPGYAAFKGELYSRIDPRFEEYFDNSPQSTIRLDEVRWGGVVQDGIPPLRNPKMISAKKAKYLADSDIVFGIEVDGDFRAYPKRILAWHEMFTDTIQGVPLAGVY